MRYSAFLVISFVTLPLYAKYCPDGFISKDDVCVTATPKEAQAACGKDIDFRKQMGPVRFQANAGLCFAYTAANMVSAKLGKPVSALDIGFSYQAKPGEAYKTPEGGDLEQALTKSLARGFCPEKNFSDANINSKSSLKDRLNYLDTKPWDQYINVALAIPYKNGEFCKDDSNLSKLFPNQNPVRLMKDVNYVMKDQAGQMIEKACAPRLQSSTAWKAENIPINFNSDPEVVFNTITSQLDQGNPVGLSLHDFPVPNAAHALTLAGHSWNKKTNQCEFIIRNSWGTNCRVAPLPSGFRCVNGDLFATKSTLIRYLNGATYLKNID